MEGRKTVCEIKLLRMGIQIKLNGMSSDQLFGVVVFNFSNLWGFNIDE